MTPPSLVNINDADLDALIAVPGIGPALAERIIKDRPYQNIIDLTRVSGIGKKSLEDLRPYLTIMGNDEPQIIELDITTADDTAGSQPLEAAETEIISEEESDLITMSVNEIDPNPMETPNKGSMDSSQQPEEEIEELIVEVEPIAPSFAEHPEAVGMDEPEPNTDPNFGTEEPIEKNTEEIEPKLVTRTQMIWTVLASMVGTIILTVLLTLGILVLINSDLRYPTLNDAIHLSNQIKEVDHRADSLQIDIDQVRDRVDVLETVAGRVTVLEDAVLTIQDDLSETQTNLAAAQEQINEMQAEIAIIQEKITAYNDAFLGIYNAVAPLFESVEETGGTK